MTTIDPALSEPTTLFLMSIDENFGVGFEIHAFLWLGLIAVFAVLAVLNLRGLRFRSYEIDQAEFGIGDQKIKIRPNTVDSQVAYRIWVELSTRKLGLPIDKEHDVITEIYDSWYGFFSVTRNLIGEIPATKLRRKDTEAIVKLSINILNNGVRPHLTEWQAKFRKWFKEQLDSKANEVKSPQEIQEGYPDYADLMADLLSVNKRLIRYRDEMYRLAIGRD